MEQQIETFRDLIAQSVMATLPDRDLVLFRQVFYSNGKVAHVIEQSAKRVALSVTPY
jgi:hypothetical protein